MKYLLDSNVCIDIMRNRHGMIEKVNTIGRSNCYISEITVAELMYGAECSAMRERNVPLVEAFCKAIKVLPITGVIHEYAKQKARLRRLGHPSRMLIYWQHGDRS